MKKIGKCSGCGMAEIYIGREGTRLIHTACSAELKKAKEMYDNKQG